jgi:uncharacterized ferredoxin-like protein
LVTRPQAGSSQLSLQREGAQTSEQELVFQVKELHVPSIGCANCGHGTIFDFETKDYLEKSVCPKCAVCNVELEVDLKEQLKAYRCFYDSMSRCERVEFRVRLG